MVLTPIELIFGLVGCILAMLIGAWMAKKQARAFSHQSHANADQTVQQNGDLPVVTFADYGDMRFLHLGTPAVQGSMKVSKPFEIHLEYQQRMMGWLLFTDLDQVSHKHAMQLGLGAASLTKFCYQHLKMRTIAIELNPQVITTCRQWFNLPKDNEKLQVVLGDAAEIASDDQWRGKIDALQVDLYDQAAASPVIDSEDFYRDCRSLLTHEGCMAVNLFGQASNYDESLKKITTAFGKDAVWAFKPTSAGNAIVLALRTPRVFDANTLQAQAQTIQTRWPLPAKKWLKTLAPISRAMTLDRSSLS
jgi:spermidine synthase